MIIQHNIQALNSYNRMSTNTSAVSKNLEKLSSGYRINRAGDDAAGLGISEKMRAQITGLERAKLNAQDGISLVQTAEGALTEVHSMLNRLVELGTQSANGVYQEDDRGRIQNEVDQTLSEIDRISDATNFNGINLLDGSLAGGGSGAAGGLVGKKIVDFKAAKSTTAYADASTVTFTDEKITINNVTVDVKWSELTATEQGILKKDWQTASKSEKEAAASLMQNKINEAVSKAGGTAGVTVEAGTTGFTMTSQLSGTSNSGIGKTSGAATSVMSMLTGNTAAVKAQGSYLGAIANTGGQFKMNIDGFDLDIDVTASAATDGSGIAGALQTAIDTTLGNYDTAAGTTGTSDALAGQVTVKLNESGQIELVNKSDAKISFSDNPGGSTADAMGLSGSGTSSTGNGLTLQVGDTADAFNKVTVSVDDMSTRGLDIGNLRVTDQGIASDSIDRVKTAINKVSENRGRLGALQNRLDHTINNLSVTTENMTAAESRIRDTDMAKEMMTFTKNNVLVQAAQSMLAQANQQPQQVLQLLR